MRALAGRNIFRVAVVALGLSTLSFAAGVAGDLSIIDPPRSGQRVVLRIPPEIPADAPRAAPLLSTAAAHATQVRLVRRPASEDFSAVVEAVQIAHEEEFGLTPVAFEMAALPQQKPYVQLRTKPAPDALEATDETKVA